MGKNFKNESLIINKIDEIEKNLQELEEIIKKEEFNPPEDIVPIPKKIKFPRGYFRKIDTIYSKYKLDLFDDKNLARNVAYAIQYTDFLNYILNRTNFGNDGLSIGSIFRKNAIISVTTVIEAYLSAMLEKVVNNCYSNCKNFSSCNSNIAISIKNKKGLNKKANKIRKKEGFPLFKECMDFLLDANLIDENFYNVLDRLRDYRNHIHIQYVEKNKKVRIRDFGGNAYNIKIYNEAINSLRRLPKIFQTLRNEISKCKYKEGR